MIAVIFEVWPKPEHKQQYLDLAAELRPILETIDGFISIERFESLTEKGKILSLSFFRAEAGERGRRLFPQCARTQGSARRNISASRRWRRPARSLPGPLPRLTTASPSMRSVII